MKHCSSVLRLLIVLFAVIVPPPVVSQSLLPTEPVETETSAPAEPDPFGRETPRGTVTGLLKALADEDYLRAARYFPLAQDIATDGADAASTAASVEAGPEEQQRELEAAAQTARKLQIALDRGGDLRPFLALSSDSDGAIDDGLADAMEKVGDLPGGADATPIYLRKYTVADGQTQWRIAPQTAAAIADFVPEDEVSSIDQADEAPEPSIGGAPLMDWLKLLGIGLLAFAAFRLVAALILAIVRFGMSDTDSSPFYRFLDAAMPPLALYFAVLTFYATADNLEVSIVARQTLLRYAAVVAWVALAWFALRLIDAISRVVIARMQRSERRQAITIVSFVRRGAKILLLAIATVSVLDTIGLDVTTGIAALGIGGLALALGAQKTIENLVGSVTLIADKPVQLGDYAGIGDIAGTIEDIGMRSTLVRTLDRTLVTIPNGYLASERIENFAVRDRFLFHQTLGVTYDTNAEAMERLLSELRRIVANDVNIIDDDARVRFHGFGDSALNIEIFAYFRTISYPNSLAMQEHLLFAIMRKLDEMGIDIAFPTQTVRFKSDAETKDGEPLSAVEDSESSPIVERN